MPSPQELLLKIEHSYANFDCEVSNYEQAVGQVQSFNDAILAEGLDRLHNCSGNIREAGVYLHQTLDLMKGLVKTASDRRRLTLLEEKVENLRRKFEQAERTLDSFTRIIHEGLN